MAIRSVRLLLLTVALVSLASTAAAAYNAVAGLKAIETALKNKNYQSAVTLMKTSNFNATLVTILPKYKVTLLVGQTKAFGKLSNWASIKKNAKTGFQIAAFNMLGDLHTKKSMLGYAVGKTFGTGDYNYLQTKLKSAGKKIMLGTSTSNGSIVDWTLYMDAQVIIHGVDTVIMPPKFK
ncbi:unnamed protein product [Closterium sp. Naga37s-1]|nr:unnamed protein product [Closterium sp. Naga37s-1]